MTNSDLVFSDIVTKSSLNSDSGFNDESKISISQTALNPPNSKEPSIKSPRSVEFITKEEESGTTTSNSVENAQAAKKIVSQVTESQRKPVVKRSVIITENKVKNNNKRSLKFTTNDDIFKEKFSDNVQINKKNEVDAETSDRGIIIS